MLSTSVKRHFSNKRLNKSVVIMANSKQADLVGQRIMQNLKTVSGVKDFEFFGYGGPGMRSEGMSGQIEVDLDDFKGKEFITTRKTKTYSEVQYSTKYNFWNFINKHFVQNANSILAQFENNEVARRLYHARPSVVLNIDNEYITFRLMDQLKSKLNLLSIKLRIGYYDNSANPLPRRHFHNRYIKDYKQWATKYVDFVHYTIPQSYSTADGFQFPGEHCGQYGTYDAVHHLYSQTKELRPLLKEESLLVNRKFFAADLEKAIAGVKSDYRARNGIPQDGTVIFFAPGNEVKEAEFCLDSVRKGIREFLLKYSSPTSLSPKAPPLEQYTTIVSVQQGSESEQLIRSFIKENEWLGRVIVVTNEDNEHFSAMAASDMGIVYDGQMIVSAAACHLPTMMVTNMRMHHQWFSDLYNRWWTPLNIIADCNVIPEYIGGEAWFGKIADTLGEWYVKPEVRYDMIRKCEYFLKDSMSYKPLDRTQVHTRDLILAADGQAYDEFKDPFRQVAHHLWNDIQAYDLRAGRQTHDLSQLNTSIPKMY